jgi:hypothetical protein
MDGNGAVTVRGRSNILMGIFAAVFPLILAAVPLGSGLVRAVWVSAWFAVIVLVVVRSARMGVSAGPDGLLIRNFGRDYRVPRQDIASIEATRSDNVSGAVTSIVIRRADGSSLVARGASSYSRRAVERWRDDLAAVTATP